MSGHVYIWNEGELNDLVASVEDGTNCGSGNLWTLDGALIIRNTATLANVDALQHLAGIDGKHGNGRSLWIQNNANLGSIAALGNLLGELQGSLYVSNNPVLASLSGLELLTGAGGLYIKDNGVLCLSASDRARLLDGTRFSLPDAGTPARVGL